MPWHLRAHALLVAFVPFWLAASGAHAFVPTNRGDPPGLVQIQAAGPEVAGEGAAARLRAVIEGIRKRLEETRPEEGEAGTPVEPVRDGAATEELRSLRERFAQLGRALAETRRERDELARRLAERERELAALRSRSEEEGKKTTAALQELQQQLDGANAALAARTRELEEAKARIAELEKGLAEERQRRAKAETAAKDAEKQINELTAALKTAWGERDSLEQQLQQAQQVLAQLQQDSDRQLAEARERIAALEKERSALRGERDELRRAAEARTKELDDLTAQLAALRRQEAALQKEKEELQAVAADAVGQLKAVSDRLFEMLAEREKLARTVAVLRESNALLEQQLAAFIGSEPQKVAPAAGSGEGAPARKEPESAPAGGEGAGAPPAQDGGREAPGQAPARPDRQAAVAPAAAGPERKAATEAPATTPAAGEQGGEPLLPAAIDGLEVSVTEDGWLRTVLAGLDFEVGSAEPRPGAEEIVRQVASLVALYSGSRIRVEGHTDALGDAERNRQLSLERAQRIRDMLVATGVDPARVEVAGYGEERPIASNDTPEGRRRNRRIEVLIRPAPTAVPDLRSVSTN